MKIIKNNYITKEKITEYECECPSCLSVLQFNENDIQIDEEDNKYIICPCCNYYIDEIEDNKIVTLDNINYPTDFYHNGLSKNTKRLSNDEINKLIKECIAFIKKNPNEPYRYIATGDSLICLFNHDNEYYFIVAKNYEDNFIDKA